MMKIMEKMENVVGELDSLKRNEMKVLEFPMATLLLQMQEKAIILLQRQEKASLGFLSV